MRYENKANNKSLECQPISLGDEFTNSRHALVTQCNVIQGAEFCQFWKCQTTLTLIQSKDQNALFPI